MLELSAAATLWIKALHIISVIAWMAGLLYLPRLFVYHTAAQAGSELSETLKIMERRLLRFIMNPAMVASVLSGGLLLLGQGLGALESGWLVVKLGAAIGLLALHMLMGRWRREFDGDGNTRSQNFYRVMNEAPTVLMIIIVIFAVVKPF